MTAALCPCGSGKSYANCCEPYHVGEEHAGESAPTAEALMRSRYSAYTLALENYLRITWHADTRPATLSLRDEHPPTRWLGLKILHCETIDATHAIVEFVARFRRGGGAAQRLHERSRFVFENGRWLYVDGDILFE